MTIFFQHLPQTLTGTHEWSMSEGRLVTSAALPPRRLAATFPTPRGRSSATRKLWPPRPQASSETAVTEISRGAPNKPFRSSANEQFSLKPRTVSRHAPVPGRSPTIARVHGCHEAHPTLSDRACSDTNRRGGGELRSQTKECSASSPGDLGRGPLPPGAVSLGPVVPLMPVSCRLARSPC